MAVPRCEAPKSKKNDFGEEGQLAKRKERRSYASRREYLIKAVYARRKKVREMALGSKCEICGYNKCIHALEFHHLDSSKKDFALSNKGYTRSWRRVKEELDKCILICANCHRELHAEKEQLPQETAG